MNYKIVALACCLSFPMIGHVKTYIKHDFIAGAQMYWQSEDGSIQYMEDNPPVLYKEEPKKIDLYVQGLPDNETGHAKIGILKGSIKVVTEEGGSTCTFTSSKTHCAVSLTDGKIETASINAYQDESVSGYNLLSNAQDIDVIDHTQYGHLSISPIHGMAVSDKDSDDAVPVKVTLSDVSSSLSGQLVTIHFGIDDTITESDKNVVLKYKIVLPSPYVYSRCMLAIAKQKDGTYGGTCSVSMYPHRMGAAKVSANAVFPDGESHIDPVSTTAKIGTYFTMTSQNGKYDTDKKDGCLLNAKNIDETSINKNIKGYVIFKPKSEDGTCIASSQYPGLSQPIVDEFGDSISFSSGYSSGPVNLYRAKVNANAFSSQNIILNIPAVVPFELDTPYDNSHYLRVEKKLESFISSVNPSEDIHNSSYAYRPYYAETPNHFILKNFFQLDGTVADNIRLFGGLLKDGTMSRYSSSIAILVLRAEGMPRAALEAKMLLAGTDTYKDITLPIEDPESVNMFTIFSASPLFIYNNILYMAYSRVSEQNKLELDQYNEQNKTWSNSGVNISDVTTYSDVKNNSLFRIKLGFQNDIYFPSGASSQQIAKCSLDVKNSCKSYNISFPEGGVSAFVLNEQIGDIIPDTKSNLLISTYESTGALYHVQYIRQLLLRPEGDHYVATKPAKISAKDGDVLPATDIYTNDDRDPRVSQPTPAPTSKD